MYKLALLVTGLMVNISIFAAVQPNNNSYQTKLDLMVAKYLAISVSENVAALVELDREISQLVRKASFEEAMKAQLGPKHFEIGLEFGVGEHIPVYREGFLLVEAHKRNPNSPFREDTLYAASISNSEPNGKRVDLHPLYAYLKEYPQGTHTGSVYFMLATHYLDLYLILRGLVNQEMAQGESAYSCYQNLISEDAYEAQMRKARVLAIENFENALKFSHGAMVWKDSIRNGVLEEIKSEKFQWNGYVTACGLGND